MGRRILYATRGFQYIQVGASAKVWISNITRVKISDNIETVDVRRDTW